MAPTKKKKTILNKKWGLSMDKIVGLNLNIDILVLYLKFILTNGKGIFVPFHDLFKLKKYIELNICHQIWNATNTTYCLMHMLMKCVSLCVYTCPEDCLSIFTMTVATCTMLRFSL